MRIIQIIILICLFAFLFTNANADFISINETFQNIRYQYDQNNITLFEETQYFYFTLYCVDSLYAVDSALVDKSFTLPVYFEDNILAEEAYDSFNSLPDSLQYLVTSSVQSMIENADTNNCVYNINCNTPDGSVTFRISWDADFYNCSDPCPTQDLSQNGDTLTSEIAQIPEVIQELINNICDCKSGILNSGFQDFAFF
jgi:hypothetical protein